MVHVPSRFSSGEQTAWCRGAVAAVQLGEERSQPSLSGGCWEQPWCVWACMWPQVHGECWPAGRGATGSLSPASPTYTLLLGGGGLFRVAWPPAPSLQLPVSWAPHSRRDCLAAIHGESSCPGPRGMGLGRVHSPSRCWRQDQRSLRSSGFDSGPGCAWRLKARVVGPLRLPALGWPRAGLSTCQSPQVSPRWNRVAPGPLSLLSQALCCCLPFPRAGVFPCEHQVGPPCISGAPLPTGHPEPVLRGRIRSSRAVPRTQGQVRPFGSLQTVLGFSVTEHCCSSS